jgi:Protein of unknown function (DUF3017)
MRFGVVRLLRTEAPFLTVLAIVAFAVIYLAAGPTHWLRGSGIVSAALLLAGLLRAVLPQRRAGMLAVRGRWWDVCCYLALGIAIIATGLVLPG